MADWESLLIHAPRRCRGRAGCDRRARCGASGEPGSVALFANEGGAYDDLAAYFKNHKGTKGLD